MSRSVVSILWVSLGVLWLTIVSAQAVTRYVDKDSSCGHAGSVTTIQAAVNASANGDVIFVCQSVTPYDEFVSITANAVAGARRTITNEPGHTPVLLYSGGANPLAQITVDGDFWTIRGLTLIGHPNFTIDRGILVRGNHNEILDNTIQDWGSTQSHANGTEGYAEAINVSGGHDGSVCVGANVDGNVVRGNIITNGRLVALINVCSVNTLLENNVISGQKCGRDTDGAVNEVGIKFVLGGSNMTIRNNQIHDFAPHSACTLTNQAFATWIGIWIDEDPANGIIEGNRIWNIDQNKPNFTNPLGNDQQSVGIMIERDVYGWTIRNNLVSNIGTQGLRQAAVTSGATTRWYNNTVSNIGFYGMWLRSGSNIDVRNNIFYNSGVLNIRTETSSVTANNNLYWDTAGGNKVGQWLAGGIVGMTAWRTASGQDANGVNANPQLVNATTRDFRLCTGLNQPMSGCTSTASPALNVGATLVQVPTDIDGTARPQPPGGAYDMGAYEMTQGDAGPPAAPTNLRVIQSPM